jgi:hypothetical protein
MKIFIKDDLLKKMFSRLIELNQQFDRFHEMIDKWTGSYLKKLKLMEKGAQPIYCLRLMEKIFATLAHCKYFSCAVSSRIS